MGRKINVRPIHFRISSLSADLSKVLGISKQITMMRESITGVARLTARVWTVVRFTVLRCSVSNTNQLAQFHCRGREFYALFYAISLYVEGLPFQIQFLTEVVEHLTRSGVFEVAWPLLPNSVEQGISVLCIWWCAHSGRRLRTSYTIVVRHMFYEGIIYGRC